MSENCIDVVKSLEAKITPNTIYNIVDLREILEDFDDGDVVEFLISDNIIYLKVKETSE